MSSLEQRKRSPKYNQNEETLYRLVGGWATLMLFISFLGDGHWVFLLFALVVGYRAAR